MAEVVFDAGGDEIDLVPGDLDGDGDLDLVTSQYYNERLQWFENAPGWPSHQNFSVLKWQCGLLATGDLSGDGLADVVRAEIYDGYYSTESPVDWYRNDAGTLLPAGQVGLRAGQSSYGVAVADLDGDGDGDVVIAQSGGTFVALNTGGGSFSPWVAIGPGLTAIRILDLDSDGLADVVHAAGFLRGVAAGLPEDVRFGAPPASVRTFDVGDVDGDGDLDVLRSAGGELVWDENLGASTFAMPVPLATNGSGFDDAVLVDLDLDGRLDVLGLWGDYGGAFWLQRLAGGGFAGAAALPLLDCGFMGSFARGGHALVLVPGANGMDVVCGGQAYRSPISSWRRQPCLP